VFYFQHVAAEPTYVVYRGFGQTNNDILSGSIDGTCELIASAREEVVAGCQRLWRGGQRARRDLARGANLRRSGITGVC